MTSPSPPPWSPDPSGGADQYRRRSQIVIAVEPDTGRPAVTLDGTPIDGSGGWQAAVDDGFAQVAATAERIGEPISVVVVDPASDWTGRFVVQPDRSIAEDLAPPPAPRRRRGPLLALLTAAAVLVAGTAVVVGTQLTSSEQPLASAPAAPPAVTGRPTHTPGAVSPSVAAPHPALPPVTVAPFTPPETAPPDPAPSDTAPPDTAPPGTLPPVTAPPGAGVPRGPEARPAPSPHPAPRPAPQPAPKHPPKPVPKPVPQPAPKPAPRPAPRPAPPAPNPAPAPAAAPQGTAGRVIDGQGACLSTSLGSGSCLPDHPEQIWTRTVAGQLATGGGCLTEVAPQKLAVQPCRGGDPAQTWRTGSRLIVNGSTGACAVVRRPESGRPVAGTVACGSAERLAQFVS